MSQNGTFSRYESEVVRQRDGVGYGRRRVPDTYLEPAREQLIFLAQRGGLVTAGAAGVEVVDVPVFADEVVGEVRVSSAADIAVAVRQARVGQPTWQALGVEGRFKALGPVVSLFEEPRQEIAEIIAREMRRRRMAPPAGCSITCAGGQPLERRARKPTALADQQHLTPLGLK